MTITETRPISPGSRERLRGLLAAAGPPTGPGDQLVVDLLDRFVAHGDRAAVVAELAPRPDDPVEDVTFELTRAGMGRHPHAATLEAVLGACREHASVQVWSKDRTGLRRLILLASPEAGVEHRPPAAAEFTGVGATEALADWRQVQGRPPGAAPASTSDALASAVEDALRSVRVEVDLGAVEDLVADCLRTALAEQPPAGGPVGPVGGLTDAAGLVALITDTVGATLAERLPELVVRCLPAPASVSGPGSGPDPDPVDIARRVAASALSPKEIAESLVNRLRPLLDDHSRAITRAQIDLAGDVQRLVGRVQRLERLAQ